ncbi:MAG: hypothetical protein KDK78_07965, partial [Chlamydiia bacterium]|nr:hypothetical protein [Chlamydiia bacterium]
MDKRSLFFVICLSITLFLVNNYFSQQDLERRRQWAEYEKQLAEYKQRQMESELQDRVAKIEALPLAEYRAGEQTRIGVLLDGNLLTISQSGDDASDVTVTEPDGRAASYARQTVEAVPGSVVLYRKAGAAVLSAGALPMDRPTEVQIVSFYLDENAPQIEQGVAMYERGQLRTVHGAPQHNGLVLVETPGGYIPAGIYLAQEKSIL